MTADDLRGRNAWRTAVFIAILTMLVVGFLVSNAIGSMKVPLRDILRIIAKGGEESPFGMVIWNVRLPRTLVAVFVGMNLAVSGAILQGVMGNPLADPGIIGISSGAGLFGMIILTLYPQLQSIVPPFAFLGAMIAALLIYALAWKGGIQPMRMILSGVAVSAFFSAGISALLVFYSDRVHGALMFMSGGLSARSWPQLGQILPYSIVGITLAVLLSGRLNILHMGDDVARSLGLNVERNRILLTAVAAILAASAVSVAGLLGFVGLIVPHTVRLLTGNDHRYLIPTSALLGSALLTLSDTFARTVFSPIEVPVGVVMAILGVPFFLYLLRRGL